MPYAVGPEQRVNGYVLSRQSAPQSLSLTDGGYVTVWNGAGEQDQGYGIYLQRFDAAGNRVGEQGLVNTTTTYSQRHPAMTLLASGGYVVTWDNTVPGGQAGDPALLGVFAQVFDASGTRIGPETQVSPLGSSQTVTALSDGSYLITWTQRVDELWSGVMAQRFDASGQALGPSWPLDQDLDATLSSVTATGSGFIAVWCAYGDTGSTVAVQGFSSDGTHLGDVVRLARDSDMTAPEIVALADGGFAVVWFQTEGLYAQLLDGDGQPAGERFLVGTAPQGARLLHAVVATPDGGFTVAWDQFSGAGSVIIEARAFLADGSPNGEILTVRGPAGAPGEPPGLAVLPSGDVVLTYTRYVGDIVDFYDVFQVRLEPLVRATRGSDAIDRLIGTDGQDRLIGLGGDDVLTGGRGNDYLDGGDGWDEAVFSGSADSYKIFAENGVYHVRGADGSDMLTGIELLRFDDRVIDLLRIVCDPVFGAPKDGEAPFVSPALAFDARDVPPPASPDAGPWLAETAFWSTPTAPEATASDPLLAELGLDRSASFDWGW